MSVFQSFNSSFFFASNSSSVTTPLSCRLANFSNSSRLDDVDIAPPSRIEEILSSMVSLIF